MKKILFTETRHRIFFMAMLGERVKKMGGSFEIKDMYRGVYHYKGLSLGLLINPKQGQWWVYFKGQPGYFSSYEEASTHIIEEFRKLG